jgi:outer membrane protein
MAYIRTNHLLTNYQGFQEATHAYQQKSSAWKANMDTLTKELKDLSIRYEAGKSEMSARERELSAELIRTKQQQLEQYREGIRQMAAQEDREMTADVVQEINLFLKEYGEKHRYRIILGATEAGNIVYAEEAMDLTDEVLDALNRRYRGE